MKKTLCISCANATITVTTDSIIILNSLLRGKNSVGQTIPGAEARLIYGIKDLNGPSIVYHNSDKKTVTIDEKNNKAEISFPAEEFFVPDLIYLMVSMLSKELNKQNKYIIHCSVVEKNGNGVMIIGDGGVGKTTLSLYLCKNKGFNFISNDRALLEFKDGEPYVTAGTLQTSVRIGAISQLFPSLLNQIDKEKLERPWKNKICIESEFENLGIRVKYSTKVSNVLFVLTYPVPEENTIFELYDPKEHEPILKTMGCFSQHIRADNNMFLSMEYPFPSFDEHDLSIKRLNDAKKFVNSTRLYSARGSIEALADRVDHLI